MSVAPFDKLTCLKEDKPPFISFSLQRYFTLKQGDVLPAFVSNQIKSVHVQSGNFLPALVTAKKVVASFISMDLQAPHPSRSSLCATTKAQQKPRLWFAVFK